ncbi:MAG: DUF2950 domain-containing protein [Deltaproteobacteria bacterium]|nr:DUF2950 domain-containing protein [Deltaproteobacteria bacterium]
MSNTMKWISGLALGAVALLASSRPAAATGKQATFATPDEATQMLVTAIKAGDTKAMLSILGPEAKDLIDSGDPVADRTSWDKFAAAYDAAHALVANGDKQVLEIGTDQWPFPIPLIQHDGRWHFDTPAGEQEIIDRRVGRNELSAMQVLLAIGDAEREYYVRNPQNAKLFQFAQKVHSAPGKRDGLYWVAKPGEPDSPLGPAVARARGEGYKQAGSGAGAPYHGYYYRILTAQGPDASGGAYDYVVRGAMIGGFALLAYPAEYDSSGVMTFMVNHEGVVYEKDLGPDTEKLARAMKLFNPDASWKVVAPPASQ